MVIYSAPARKAGCRRLARLRFDGKRKTRGDRNAFE